MVVQELSSLGGGLRSPSALVEIGNDTLKDRHLDCHKQLTIHLNKKITL